MNNFPKNYKLVRNDNIKQEETHNSDDKVPGIARSKYQVSFMVVIITMLTIISFVMLYFTHEIYNQIQLTNQHGELFHGYNQNNQNNNIKTALHNQKDNIEEKRTKKKDVYKKPTKNKHDNVVHYEPYGYSDDDEEEGAAVDNGEDEDDGEDMYISDIGDGQYTKLDNFEFYKKREKPLFLYNVEDSDWYIYSKMNFTGKEFSHSTTEKISYFNAKRKLIFDFENKFCNDFDDIFEKKNIMDDLEDFIECTCFCHTVCDDKQENIIRLKDCKCTIDIDDSDIHLLIDGNLKDYYSHQYYQNGRDGNNNGKRGGKSREERKKRKKKNCYSNYKGLNCKFMLYSSINPCYLKI